MSGPYIPPATRDKLNGDHPEGTRHKAKVDIALSLLGNGLTPSAVLAELRGKFPAATEHECRDVVQWAQGKNPTPSGYGDYRPVERFKTRFVSPTIPTPAEVSVPALVNGASAPEEDWLAISPVRIPQEPEQHAAALIEHLYKDGEFLCAVIKHGQKPDGRTFPVGGGKTGSRAQWLEMLATRTCPSGPAGTWWRINPVTQTGTGNDNSHRNEDVTAFRFVLVEHDKLPLDVQLAVLCRFREFGLPIAALIRTGGKSIHAWVRLNADSIEDYDVKIEQLLSITKPLGFDHNRNPSRLARIPGVQRKLGAIGDGWQRLIYLNPDCGAFDFEAFKSKMPIPGIVRGDTLIERVREWMKPRKAAFTMTVLRGNTPEDGIYFRPAEVTLWTGVASHGKSTLLKQCMMELMCEKTPFFVASMEHRAEDVCEGLARASYQKPPTGIEVEKFLGAFGHLVYFLDMVGEVVPAELLDKMRRCHAQTDAQHFFVDSLMRVAGLEEDYPAQTAFLNDLQSFAKETKSHIHLVTHPRKIDETQRARKMDVKGSNNIINNADNILSVRRNVQKDEANETGKSKTGDWDAEVSVEKQRATGWQGSVKLTFNFNAKTFSKYKPSAAPERRSYHNE